MRRIFNTIKNYVDFHKNWLQNVKHIFNNKKLKQILKEWILQQKFNQLTYCRDIRKKEFIIRVLAQIIDSKRKQGHLLYI